MKNFKRENLLFSLCGLNCEAARVPVCGVIAPAAAEAREINPAP